MIARTLVVTAGLVAGAVFVTVSSTTEAVPVRQELSGLPLVLGEWEGRLDNDFDQRVLGVLGVDDYVNRLYSKADGGVVGLYVGYYESQREGDTIHSPLNCLPGSGWTPMKKGRIRIAAVPGSGLDPAAAAEDGTFAVNRFVIQKGLDRQVVLYWYQSHGRAVASEYWGKIYMVLDAVRLNRTDGALVRVISPIRDSEARAEADALDFVSSLLPVLGRYLPE